MALLCQRQKLVIRKAIFGNHLQQHLQEHDQLSLATFQDVDWDAIELATVLPSFVLTLDDQNVSGFLLLVK